MKRVIGGRCFWADLLRELLRLWGWGWRGIRGRVGDVLDFFDLGLGLVVELVGCWDWLRVMEWVEDLSAVGCDLLAHLASFSWSIRLLL